MFRCCRSTKECSPSSRCGAIGDGKDISCSLGWWRGKTICKWPRSSSCAIFSAYQWICQAITQRSSVWRTSYYWTWVCLSIFLETSSLGIFSINWCIETAWCLQCDTSNQSNALKSYGLWNVSMYFHKTLNQW